MVPEQTISTRTTAKKMRRSTVALWIIAKGEFCPLKVAWALIHPPVTSDVRPASSNWQLGASPPDCRKLDFIIIYSTSTDWTENIRILFTLSFKGIVVLMVIIVIVRLLHICVNGKYSMIHIIHRW